MVCPVQWSFIWQYRYTPLVRFGSHIQEQHLGYIEDDIEIVDRCNTLRDRYSSFGKNQDIAPPELPGSLSGNKSYRMFVKQ